MLKQLFASNIDKFGLITKNNDGGDSCSRHMTALYCLPHDTADIRTALDQLQVNGIPIRHPDADKWYSSTNRTSRDQLIPYLCFVATPNHASPHRVRNAFYALVAQHAKRLFVLTWNTKRNWQYPTLEEHTAKSTPDVVWNYDSKLPDICFANVWAIYLRGWLNHSNYAFLLLPLIYPMLHLLDLYALASVLLIVAQRLVGMKPASTRVKWSIDHDMQNLTLPCHFSASHWATGISALTWLLIKPIGNEAARSFFQQPEEPRLDIAIKLLK